ncbi:MAG: hypothetical protein JKY90_05645 [Gammaproteobacteria bacterium]|nr:hypothetical protein [Gammaproteobacteria bacterium]
MNRFIRTVFDLCLLRAGPQQLPFSSSLLTFCLITYFALDVALAKLSIPFIDPMIFAGFDVVLLLGFVWFLLSFKGYYSRFTQTATAFAGSSVLLGIVAWALLSWQASFAGTENQVPLPSLLLLFHLIWSLAVISNIVRHAISITIAWAWGVTLAYFFIYILIMRLIAIAFS